MTPEFLTAEQMAAKLQVRADTLYGWARAKRIPSMRVGRTVRFHPETVVAAMAGYGLNDGRQKAWKGRVQ